MNKGNLIEARRKAREKKSYLEVAREIVERANTMKSGKHGEGRDDKCYVEKDEFEALLGVGACIIEMNGKCIGGNYSNLVRYEGYLFTHQSERPEPFHIKPSRVLYH